MTWRVLGFVVFLIGMGGAPVLAQSANQCIDSCFSTFSPSQMQGSDEPRRECLERCNAKSSTQFGAIAFGARSDAYGYAFGKGNAGDATRTAMQNCRANGDDCKLVGSYSNSCMAVVAVEAKNRFVSAVAPNRSVAQADAMKQCQAKIGGKCEMEVWSCSGP